MIEIHKSAKCRPQYRLIALAILAACLLSRLLRSSSIFSSVVFSFWVLSNIIGEAETKCQEINKTFIVCKMRAMLRTHAHKVIYTG